MNTKRSSSHNDIVESLNRCETRGQEHGNREYWTGNPWLFEREPSAVGGWHLPLESRGPMSTFKKSAFNDIASWISGKKDIQSFLDVGTCSAALPICVKLRNPDLDVYGIDVKDFFSQNTPVISNIGMEIGEHFFCAGMDELAHELNESDDLFFDCIAITGVVHAFKLGNPRPAGLKNLLNLAPSRCKYFICDNASWVTNMFQDQGAIFEVIKKIEMVPPEGTGSEWTYDGLFIIRF